MASPENVKGWLAVIMPTLEKSTPVTLLFMFVIGTLTVWHLLGQVRQERDRGHTLAQWLLEEKAAHLDLALRCARINGLKE